MIFRIIEFLEFTMLGMKTSYSASAATAIELSIRTIFDKQDNISSTRLKEQWSESH